MTWCRKCVVYVFVYFQILLCFDHCQSVQPNQEINTKITPPQDEITLKNKFTENLSPERKKVRERSDTEESPEQRNNSHSHLLLLSSGLGNTMREKRESRIPDLPPSLMEEESSYENEILEHDEDRRIIENQRVKNLPSTTDVPIVSPKRKTNNKRRRKNRQGNRRRNHWKDRERKNEVISRNRRIKSKRKSRVFEDIRNEGKARDSFLTRNDSKGLIAIGKKIDRSESDEWRMDLSNKDDFFNEGFGSTEKYFPITTSRDNIENVEREFSRYLEKEIIRSSMDEPRTLNDRIFAGSFTKSELRDTLSDDTSKNDEESLSISESSSVIREQGYDLDKMLGYSKTDEDIPILDMENQVLARTMKDYNAYMIASKSNPVSSSFSRDGSNGYEKNDQINNQFNLTRISKGDLSCINGTFVPAPLIPRALIKYVKSSSPGHEYLEANYECVSGYYMVTDTSKLLCQNRHWIGQLPNCQVKRKLEGVCSDSPCEQICQEVHGRAECSCYKGFRLYDNQCIDTNECPTGMKRADDDSSCIDMNECESNDGRGPCQGTCRNFIGGYECSCEGMQDTILSTDNHTCQNTGACSINNAGCSHTCLSTMGRVFCLCPDGFILEDDWKTCRDVDECAVPDLQSEICRYGCINTPGSYRCANPGELKDVEFESVGLTNACLPGYYVQSDASCHDVDECANENGGCTEVCENTEGSFFCACEGDEKVLSSDGKSCVDINSFVCPALNPAGRGYLMCSHMTASKSWQSESKATTNRAGTKCFLKCPRGYELHGEYELTCRRDGTWDGPKHGECVKYGRPRLECPKDVIAELPPGRDEAFVTFDQPSTDLDWFRYVRSEPSWGTRLEANLKIGVHQVTFFARHPVSKKLAICILRIVVQEGEAPKVQGCPNDIEVNGRNGTAIVWKEPIFTDNVKVVRINNNESPGRSFDVGGHKVEYEASDEAGWSSKCVFTVVLRQEE